MRAIPFRFAMCGLWLAIAWPACAATAPAVADEPPEFVKNLIAAFSAAPPTSPPARIVRYTWHEQTVYFVPARCCDVPSALYSASGVRLCEPDGGFVGTGDGNCPDFREKRSDEHPVWTDARKGKS